MTSQQATQSRNPEIHAGAGTQNLYSPYRLGEIELRRAVEGNVPSPLAPTYSAQRATAGLIVSEATQVSPQGIG